MSLESQLNARADREFAAQFRKAREPLLYALWDLLGDRGNKLFDEFIAQPEILKAYATAEAAHRERYIAAFLKKCDEASAAQGEGS